MENQTEQLQNYSTIDTGCKIQLIDWRVVEAKKWCWEKAMAACAPLHSVEGTVITVDLVSIRESADKIFEWLHQ